MMEKYTNVGNEPFQRVQSTHYSQPQPTKHVSYAANS